jgi:hypothetical protein
MMEGNHVDIAIRMSSEPAQNSSHSNRRQRNGKNTIANLDIANTDNQHTTPSWLLTKTLADGR